MIYVLGGGFTGRLCTIHYTFLAILYPTTVFLFNIILWCSLCLCRVEVKMDLICFSSLVNDTELLSRRSISRMFAEH